MIPVNRPLLDGNESEYLQECITSGWVGSEGPFVKRFEEAFAAYLGRKYAIAVSSGTAALDIAVSALRPRYLRLPTMTIISCVRELERLEIPYDFVDSDPDTWNMTVPDDPFMAVHLWGLPVDISERSPLIEDCSQMLGQTYYGKKCGTLGSVSTFSFYPNKLITCGEGGMLATDDEWIARECRSLRDLYHGPRFHHARLGFNYRMSNLQAAVGLAQLEGIDRKIRRKRQIGERYNQGLKGLNVQLPQARTPYAENLYWVYPVVTDRPMATALKKQGIETRPFFYPLHLQPCLNGVGSFPVAEYLSSSGLYLPSGNGTTDEEIDQVIAAVRANA